jgi:uncharacterized protein YoxC
METTLQVVQIIAFTSLSVLCVTLVVVLIRVRRILEIVEKDFRLISAKAMPVLDNLEVITERVKRITETIGEQADALKQMIGSFTQAADNVVSFERRIQDRIEEPLMGAADTFAAIFKGIQAFLERIPFVGRLRAE